MRRLGLLLIAVLLLPGVDSFSTARAQARRGVAGAGRRQPPPHVLFDRLNRMKPDQRQRALERLPPERRRLVEQRLERYNRMSPEERERLKDQYDIFRQLAPENQQAVRRMFNRFSSFPEERRALMRSELDELRQLDETGRRARLDAAEFREKFTGPERRLLEDLSAALPAPE